jgi:hypothetical protein
MKAPASAVFGLMAVPPTPTAKPWAVRSDQADRGLGGDRAPVAVTRWEARFARAGLVLLALAGSVGLAAAWPHRPIPQAPPVVTASEAP